MGGRAVRAVSSIFTRWGQLPALWTDQFDLQEVLAGVRVDPEQGAVWFGGAEADGEHVTPAVRQPARLVLVLYLTASLAELVAHRLWSGEGGAYYNEYNTPRIMYHFLGSVFVELE